LGAQRIIS
jgi:threonine dehydrogenase-like Zn-dependent dehydrogenase/phenylpyruvate tautomerase PptA (4-oxalocrotonate tautomerase family)